MGTTLPEIADAEKELSGALPPWNEDESGKFDITVPLEIRGITVQRLYFKAHAVKDRFEEDVTFQLIGSASGERPVGFDRIDWRPYHIHMNQGGCAPELRFLTLAQSHRHAFHLNWLADQKRLRAGNLPVAMPLDPEPNSWEELLVFVGNCFKIKDLGRLEAPGWERVLL